jgi:two-component sensor histidine kinase
VFCTTFRSLAAKGLPRSLPVALLPAISFQNKNFVANLHAVILRFAAIILHVEVTESEVPHMQAILESTPNTATLLAQKRRIITGWLWRTATDPRLRHGGLPHREWVDCVCEVVDFLFSAPSDNSLKPEEISLISDTCSRVLVKSGASADQAVLEFGHLRAALLDTKDTPLYCANIEQLSILCDSILAQVVARCADSDSSNPHKSRRWRKQPEGDPRQFTLAVVGHELRSLLTPIVTWIDLLARSAKEDVGREQTVTLQHGCSGLQRSVRGLKRLVDDLNDYAALTRGKLTMRLIAQDLRAMVGDCMESFEPHAKKASIDLRLINCDQPLMVTADEMRLQQCLTNLLNNTIKFTPAGGSVEIRLSASGKRGIIEVSDSGKGMLPSELALLFEPFQQLEEGRNAGGLGLGLALVKSIVEMHSGHIEAISAGRDKGTTFRIDLPLMSA